MDDYDEHLSKIFASILNETREIILPEEPKGKTVSLNSLRPSQRQEVLAAFEQVRFQQQGEAEYMGGGAGSAANPSLFHGAGVYTVLTEHLGDLLNRMTQKYCERIDFGHEMVKEKVDRALRYVTDSYGFKKEIDENLKSNWIHAGSPDTFENWISDFDAARKRYVDAHQRLPIYNEVQRLARQVAIDLGQRADARLETNLELLKRHLSNKDHWNVEASMVMIGGDGSLLPL